MNKFSDRDYVYIKSKGYYGIIVNCDVDLYDVFVFDLDPIDGFAETIKCTEENLLTAYLETKGKEVRFVHDEPSHNFKVGDYVKYPKYDNIGVIVELESDYGATIEFFNSGEREELMIGSIKKIQYRPFANVEEFRPHFDRKITLTENDITVMYAFTGVSQIKNKIDSVSFGRSCTCNLKDLLENYTFLNGEPCGVPEEVE